jgi:hypothetical protein
MDTMTVTIRGMAPLLLHNGRISDPLSKFAIELKKLSNKRDKTESDYAEISKLEWFGALYTDENDELIMPGENIESMLVKAAQKIKKGTLVKAGVIVPKSPVIAFKGPKNPEEMWASEKFVDKRGVVIKGKGRIVRTRPRIDEWSLTFDIVFSGINKNVLEDILVVAGREIGIGDFRPKFGRFELVNGNNGK